MSSFTALNIEPAEDVQEEIDDTKEIQIEEALKLYQNALKLHSQGPPYYAQAKDAYNALLQSEIFKYSESVSGFHRNISEGDIEDAIGEIDANDAAASALPQTIFLSYKNHGQFILDVLKESLRKQPSPTDVNEQRALVAKDSRSAVGMFAEALERDDTDLDLWRKSARIGATLNSYRLARYCLESVLVGDDNEVEVSAEQLGLDELFAAEDLRNVRQALKDELSSIQAPPLKKPRQAFFRFFRNHSQDPYPYLPALTQDVSGATTSITNQPGARYMIEPSDRTWNGIGKAILRLLVRIKKDSRLLMPGTTVGISTPSRDITPQSPGQGTLSISANPHSMENHNELTETHNTAEVVDDQSSIDQRAESQLRESLEGLSKQPAEAPTTTDNMVIDTESQTPSANPRKRSSASMGNDEAADSIRTKSRRIRARESNAENLLQTEVVSHEKNFEDRLEKYSHADEWMFGTVGDILSKARVEALGTIDDLKRQFNLSNNSSCPQSKDVEAILVHDLQSALRNWDEEKSRSATQGDSSTALQDSRGRKRSGLAIFLDHSRKPKQKATKQKPSFEDCGLDAFTEEINECKLHLHEVAFRWLGNLLKPGKKESDKSRSDWCPTESSYMSSPWPDNLKETIVQLLIQEDSFIHDRLNDEIAHQDQDTLEKATSGGLLTCTDDNYAQADMIQAIHELHLDIYAQMNNPNSETDQDTRALQRDRLIRWSILAQVAINGLFDRGLESERLDRLALRHLWSMTFHSNMAEDVDRDHVMLCLQALKNALSSSGKPDIVITNNSFMPEISLAALDQEISRLNSMGFFMRIFGSEGEDPVTLIESIEPVLDPSSVEYVQDGTGDKVLPSVPAHFQELSSFLDRGDASLRLFLWRRLQDAYRAIDYVPKVVSCQLRSIEAIVKEIQGDIYLGSQDDRPSILLRWLKSVNNILTRLVPQLIDDPIKSFECIDVDHLRSSMTAVACLSRLLHSFALYEDAVKVGQRPPLELRGSLGKSLENFKEKLRDMQVRCWVLQYLLVKEYMVQAKEEFTTASDEQIHFLRSVHNALGVRSTCKYADKVLLRLMKSELLSIETQEDCEFDIAQVLFDLHGFKFSNQLGISDHGCPTERPNAQSAAMMIDFVLMQVNRLNIKDLSRSDLKTTIEKVQQAIGPVKHQSLAFNRRILSSYLKSPINPSEMLRLVQGVGGLALRSVQVYTAEYARKGWYFVLGHAALSKFRSQKRLSPVTTVDLDDAIGYFRQDLEYATERWETWFRLAQTYDSKLDEDIMWSADKINNGKAELTNIQRTAIHCYAMAVAGALRAGDDDPKSRATISDLFTDFGMRLYASSREPLCMAAFSLEEIERHFSDFDSQKVYKSKPFREMRVYAVWSLAAYMFKRAMVDKPDYWLNHYMLSKCSWKMFNSDETTRGSGKTVTLDDVLDPLLDAIETLPQRKERGSSDPIFEPHFRLVSVLHKLVLKELIEPSKAGEILSETPWAKKLSPPQNKDDWKPYVLETLKSLKNADKSNWHHRILARLAHVHYYDYEDATAAATAAKNELMPQIFTKTMSIQVWRPEFERPGRHFVYTTRYVSFFIQMLDQTSDRSNLEQLLRKVRKKQGDFINHSKLWEDMCIIYAKLVRRAANISEHFEDGIFKVLSWDDFVTNTARLDGFTDLAVTNGPTIDLLREAVEFKKLNNNLMKVTMFEDLIADLYARLYDENSHRFIEQANDENRTRMKVDHLMNTDGATDAATPPTSAPPSEVPAPRGRTKGISRRDIQKRAEALVSHHARPLAAKAAPAQADEEKISSAPIVKIPVLSNLRGDAAESESAAPDSVPNSLHESADDESELSEIDDDRLAKLKAEQSLMFPNLKSSKSPEPVSEASFVASVDGDGDGDGEMAADDENIEQEGDDDMKGENGLAYEGDGDTEMQTAAEDEQAEEADEIAANNEEEDIEMTIDKADTECDEEEGDGDLNADEADDGVTTLVAEDADETEINDDEGTVSTADKEGGGEEDDKSYINPSAMTGEEGQEVNDGAEATDASVQDEEETAHLDEEEP